MDGLFKSILWSAVNGPALVDELHFAIVLAGGISEDLFAQPQYHEFRNLPRILVETDRRYMKHNEVSLASLIHITENRDGWLQKADISVDKDLFRQVQGRLPDTLLVYLPNHYETVSVKIQK